MKNKLPIVFAIIFNLLIGLTSCAQKNPKIQGTYKIDGAVLVIDSNNKCFLLAENTALQGIVEIDDTIVTIKPYVPKVPFVLYGRKSELATTRNTIMFQGFDEAKTLINFDEDNNSIKKMKRVFNPGANCIDYPNVFRTPFKNSKFYFSVEGQKELYVFDNNQQYSDFIVLYLPQKGNDFEFELTLNKGKDTLFYDGDILEKLDNSMSKSEMEQIVGMFNRAYSESENYYCNPAYNFFEEDGINVHTAQYQKVEHAGAYYFKDKYNRPGDEKDYHNRSKIYEYRKINPKILLDNPYTIDTASVFHFTCKNE